MLQDARKAEKAGHKPSTCAWEEPRPGPMARGWVTALEGDRGRVLWRFQAPTPIVAGVTPAAGALVPARAQRRGTTFQSSPFCSSVTR